jgi:rhodanese-related sulfurtransferase
MFDSFVKLARLLPLAAAALAWPGTAPAKDVKIADYLPEVKVNVGGKIYTIERIQNEENEITGSFAKTSRKCPPFCIHPMEAAPGVTTVGELELLEFLKNKVEKGTGLLIDARVPSFYDKGTIPGAVNVPFTAFTGEDKDPNALVEALRKLGVSRGMTVNWTDSVHKGADKDFPERDLKWDFTTAKDILLFCNGSWCDQSPRAIRALVKLGYPVNKIYYYRGGMQEWLLLGLSVTVPTKPPVKPASAPAPMAPAVGKTAAAPH